MLPVLTMSFRAIIVAALLSGALAAPMPSAGSDGLTRLSHSVRSLNPNLSLRDVAVENAVESVEAANSVDSTDATEHGPDGEDEKNSTKGKPNPNTAKPSKPAKEPKPKTEKTSGNKPHSEKPSGKQPKAPKPKGQGKQLAIHSLPYNSTS